MSIVLLKIAFFSHFSADSDIVKNFYNSLILVKSRFPPKKFYGGSLSIVIATLFIFLETLQLVLKKEQNLSPKWAKRDKDRIRQTSPVRMTSPQPFAGPKMKIRTRRSQNGPTSRGFSFLGVVASLFEIVIL